MPLFPQDPHVPGDEPYCRGTLTGPVSYTAVTPGAVPTGGQVLLAKDIGFTAGLTFIQFLTDSTGQYSARAIFPSSQLIPFTSVILQWFVTATGAEVAGAVNLSAKVLRFRAEGRY